VLNFYNIGMYRSDTMKLARTALGYGVFVSTEYPDDFFRGDGDDDEKGAEYDYITPGGVHYLRPGESINTVKPENPGAQYEPFLRSELRGASLGAGMSYESASNDGSQTNFSGTRQMLLFDRAMTRYTFAIFEEKFYSRLYRWFVEFEMDFGKPALRLAGYDMTPEKYLRCSWSRPRTEWVDPLKDAKAGKEEVDMGINTLTELCNTTGRDIEEVVAERKYENKLFQSAGLKGDEAALPAEDVENAGVNDEVNKWLT
jgi:capsid protein